jgi:DNA-binding CsgD family transcriptional regulator
MTIALYRNENTFSWVDWLNEPTILIAYDRELLAANEAGRIILIDEFPLRLRNNQLAGATLAIDSAIRSAIVGKNCFSILERHPATNAIIALWGSARDDVLCIRVSPLSQNSDLLAGFEFGDTFKLTPAERRILLMIFANLSAAEIASRLGLSIETIRTHRKRIYAKVGVNGRSDMLILFTRAFVV